MRRRDERIDKYPMDALCANCGRRYGAHNYFSDGCPLYPFDGQGGPWSQSNKFAPQKLRKQNGHNAQQANYATGKELVESIPAA